MILGPRAYVRLVTTALWSTRSMEVTKAPTELTTILHLLAVIQLKARESPLHVLLEPSIHTSARSIARAPQLATTLHPTHLITNLTSALRAITVHHQFLPVLVRSITTVEPNIRTSFHVLLALSATERVLLLKRAAPSALLVSIVVWLVSQLHQAIVRTDTSALVEQSQQLLLDFSVRTRHFTSTFDVTIPLVDCALLQHTALPALQLRCRAKRVNIAQNLCLLHPMATALPATFAVEVL